ncbi:sterol desaturase family protein [Croceicoccus sp. F390]|uniref:Sterol desaturase family protein n=1 Tax=Croceicoccus esteveae TaxID=3075597 RepID=A0ABU2ZHK9_9SPHN|nr:sterol desaturase family protein [Croceicoccus sp. F390]MDT0576080.1 sterol desaturase family protein [Croceicoccus sp. F390]
MMRAIMSPAEKILIVVASALAMEGVAWSAHKYIMHGFGWGWHRDHHERHDGFFERNDWYALVGAAMSISMFAIGSTLVMGANAWAPGTWIGMGILVYGIIYTLVHDGLVHQRWFRFVPRRGYLKRLVQAHNLHHATQGKEGGVSFGFIFARHPQRLKQELARQRQEGRALLRDGFVPSHEASDSMSATRSTAA